MGELILCSHPIAAMPYYIDNISLNVYSLEELCYYIENHLYLIEADFMSEELCLWIGQELDEKDLAQSLRSVLLGNGSLSDFTELILRSCGYCSEDTIRHIRSVLLDMQNKSVFECSKIRADRYMESEKYVKAIHEYRKLLGMEEECKKNPVLEGNIRHNLGTACAELFLFDEAAANFLNAYRLNQNREYKKIRDGYQIKVKNTKEATKLIVEHQDLFTDYEVVKGGMDDVFLAVTGKKLGGER